MRAGNIKKGLTLIIVGIILTLVVVTINIVQGCFPSTNSAAALLRNIANVSSILAFLFELIGIVLCGTGHSVNFRNAFICMLIIAILAIVNMIIGFLAGVVTVDFFKTFFEICTKTIAVVTGLLNLFFIYLVIRGCREVTVSFRVVKLADVTLLMALIHYVAMTVWSTYTSAANDAVRITMSIIVGLVELAYNVLFLILLIKTRKTTYR